MNYGQYYILFKVWSDFLGSIFLVGKDDDLVHFIMRNNSLVDSFYGVHEHPPVICSNENRKIQDYSLDEFVPLDLLWLFRLYHDTANLRKKRNQNE